MEAGGRESFYNYLCVYLEVVGLPVIFPTLRSLAFVRIYHPKYWRLATKCKNNLALL